MMLTSRDCSISATNPRAARGRRNRAFEATTWLLLAVLSSHCSPKSDSATERTTEALSSSAVVTQLSVPSTLTSGAFLVAQNKVQIDSGVTVTGSVWSGGAVVLQPGAQAQSITATGDVQLSDRDTVTSITLGGSLITGKQDTIGSATKKAMSNATISDAMTFPATTQSVVANSGQTIAMVPGSYTTVTANSGGTLSLAPGDYYFSSLDLESASTLKINTTASATRIFIASALTFRASMVGAGDGSRFLIVYVGTNAATLESAFTGSVVAPNALLTLGIANGQAHSGSFMAQSIEVQPNAKLKYVPFNGAGTTAICAPGTWSQNASPLSPCAPKTTCGAGSYVASEGTTMSDRTCASCTSGTFSTTTNASSCAPWATCTPGMYATNAPTASSNRLCAPCASGTYSSSNNQSACLPDGTCAAGTVQTGAGTATSPTVCAHCVAGQYCAGGTSPRLDCPAGTWDHDGDPATACVAKTICLAGSYVASEGTATTDRVCTSCLSGTFSTTQNATSCAAWTACSPGSYVSSVPSPTADRACATCASGTYSNGSNQSTCLPDGVCPAGKIQTAAGTATSPTVCTACVPGQYCAGGTAPAVTCASGTWDNDSDPATSCVAQTICAPGNYVATVGTATTDNVCTPCASGTFSTASNASACASWSTCAPSTFVSNLPSNTVDRVCLACAAGTYSSAPNQSSCSPDGTCAAGTVQTAAGTSTAPTVCQACVAGEYCAGGTAPAVACAPGTFDDDSNPATPCVPMIVCAPGSYMVADGTPTSDRMCSACAGGSFSTSADAASCTAWTDCAVGSYTAVPPSAANDRVCAPCAASTFSATSNAPSCTPWSVCGPGSFIATAGTSSSDQLCATCLSGTFSASNNASACTSWSTCGPGSYVTNPGTSSGDRVCAPCPPGLGSTSPNQSVCAPLCTPVTCASFPAGTCGQQSDGCGGLTENCGTCTFPEICGGGGVPNQCGDSVTPCVPLTNCAAGQNCGVSADGCGGVIPCGTCTLPEICGGGGTPGQCGNSALLPDGGIPCTPTTCAALGYNCGVASDGCGGLLACGTCTNPQYCGGGGYNICGGNNGLNPNGTPVCIPSTCAALGYDCGEADDGCGNVLQCGNCTAPQFCGGGGYNVCGPPELAPCSGGASTTLSGYVFDPANSLPVYNALVYVPVGTVQTPTTGVNPSNPSCGCSAPPAYASAHTDIAGGFTLTNLPSGTTTVVVELGKWQRVFTQSVVSCQANTVSNGSFGAHLTLPKTHAEGNIPRFAIDTGAVDSMECVLSKMGIATSEFVDPAVVSGVPTAAGRVHFYKGSSYSGGAIIDSTTPTENVLTESATTMNAYDAILFPCQGGAGNYTAAHGYPNTLGNLLSYTGAGGRMFATHYHYDLLQGNGSFSSTAVWGGTGGSWGSYYSDTKYNANIDLTFPVGVTLAQWLNQASVYGGTYGVIPVGVIRSNVTSITSPARRWLSTAGTPAGGPGAGLPIHYTFDTPFNQSPTCGRVVYSDFHVESQQTSASYTNILFPNECPGGPTGVMSPQEKLLEFMLLNLTSCVSPPPACTPRTCADFPGKCGVQGDGCGGVTADCGTCTAPQTCGGGGEPSVCGYPPAGACVPKTCADYAPATCGKQSDGCGGSTADCNPCTAPAACGGGGVPSQCGYPNPGCVPLTCADYPSTTCGEQSDGCGGMTAFCNPCTAPAACGGAGVPSQCGFTPPTCTPATCSSLGATCGYAADGCGGVTANCGTCPSGTSCMQNHCVGPDAGAI